MARPPSRRRRERRQQRSKEKKKRQQDELLELAFLICVLEEEETATKSRGTRKGSKNIRRVRKTVDAMLHQLGRYARKAYGMSVEAFKELASTLKEGIEEEFNPCSKRKHAPNGLISPELRLSAAIRYFKGGAVVDIMLSHGIGRSTVYASADGIIDVVNKCTSLDFNEGGASFPSHEEQKEIAKGFQRMSGAGFSKVVAAVDGMLIWTVKPRKKDCRRMQCGEVMFHCFRKDKYGINLLAMVDHKLRFRWICMNSPGRTSDYLSWINSGLPEELEKRGIILKGYTIIGDNAFVETEYMATPIPGTYLDDVEDGYNFYLSQLRITVERAFGVLVHRWGILRRPLSLSKKHNAINYHAVREAVAAKILQVGKEDGDTNLADLLTKVVTGQKRWDICWHIFR